MAEYVIERAKLTGYLLNLDHPEGAPKCRLFLRYGFDRQRPMELAQALTDHAQSNRPASRTIVGRVVSKRVVSGPLATPSGARPNAVSVWDVSAGRHERLITAYIR